MAASGNSSYGEVVEVLRGLCGSRVLAQMRSTAAGDHLTVRGVLGELGLFADQAVNVAVGGVAEIVLHFDQVTDAHVSEEGVRVRYGSGAVFRCVREARLDRWKRPWKRQATTTRGRRSATKPENPRELRAVSDSVR